MNTTSLKSGRPRKNPVGKRGIVIRRSDATCLSCKRYPCFKGIETISSNLAETCHRYSV